MSGKKLKFILRQLNPLIICIHQMLSLSSAMFITPFFHINPYNLHPKLIEQSSVHRLVICVKLIIDHPLAWSYMLKKK